MAQTKSTLAEVLNEYGFDEGINIASSAGALPAAVANKVAIEATGGNEVKGCNGLDRAWLAVENSTAAEKEITVAAGANPPSVRSGLGTLVVKLPEKTITLIAIDSSRHISAAGSLVTTVTSGTTGKIALIVLKKGGGPAATAGA